MKNNISKLQLLLTKIPRGKVTTYKEIARAMGTKGYRYIGYLLHNNPEPEKYPCYKVIQSDGKIGGYAKGGKAKIRLLKKDGIMVKDGKISDFRKRFYGFTE